MESKTLKKLLTIVLLTITISYALDKLIFFGLNKISDNVMSGQAIGKTNQFLSVKDTTDFIVFGNSRANHHIDVDIFSNNAYNMGVDGTGIAYSSTLINTLNPKKEQTVLVHIDTKNFFDEDYDGSDIRGLKTKYHRDKKITQALNNSKQLSILQSFYYSMNYNGNAFGIIKNYFKPSYDHKLYNGYDPLKISESQKSMRNTILAQNAEVDYNCNKGYKVNEVALSYLKSIKEFSENSKKKFIFITSPTYDDNCSEDNEKLSEIMNQLNLEYKDYSNLNQLGDKSYWKDLTHMSQKGAEVFSKKLKEDIAKGFN